MPLKKVVGRCDITRVKEYIGECSASGLSLRKILDWGEMKVVEKQ